MISKSVRSSSSWSSHSAIATFSTVTLLSASILGSDAAGEVVEAGSAVTRFRVGDRVLGQAVGVEKNRNAAAEGAFQTYTVLQRRRRHNRGAARAPPRRRHPPGLGQSPSEQDEYAHCLREASSGGLSMLLRWRTIQMLTPGVSG